MKNDVASMSYIWGDMGDKLAIADRMDLVGTAMELAGELGVTLGLGAHSLQVPIKCDRAGVKPDFYVKTFHHDKYWSAHPNENRSEFMHDLEYDSIDRTQYHDNLWCPSANEVEEFFKTVNTPWIAYKVLAAGAIDPEDGFKFAFERGADFICVGMFDFQIIPNANIVYNTLNSGLNRDRDWLA